MASFNQVTLLGNLVRDPEMRVTPRGTAITQFGLAVNRTFKDESGQSREEVLFIDCEAWSKTAEIISKYLYKGSPCLISGRLKQDQWEDKQTGQKRSKIKVVVDNVQFLGGRSQEGEGVQRDAPAEAPQVPQERHTPSGERFKPRPGPDGAAFDPGDPLDEDVPF